MSIHDYLEKIKPLYPLLTSIVVAIIFFALGRLSVIEERQAPIRILGMQGQVEGGAGSANNPQDQSLEVANVLSAVTSGNTASQATSENSPGGSATTPVVPVSTTNSGEVIGSKSGKKYYFPWCGTVKRVKPENQVHFASIAEARAAGYLPGGNCKGLK